MLKSWLKINKSYFTSYFKTLKKIDLTLLPNKSYIFIFLAADYNNLGDIAITVAQKAFLTSFYSDEYQIIEIPYEQTYHVIRQIKKNITKDSIITLIGGGNSGSIYEFMEAPRRFLLKIFKSHKIISFPQTVIYNDNKEYIPYQKEFLKLCKKCENLAVIAREKRSFEEYNKVLGDMPNILLTPDIVFYLDHIKTLKDRKDQVCFVLRDDKEKDIGIEFQNTIIDIVSRLFTSTVFRDTCDINITSGKEQVIYNYLEDLASNKLVVTDRLHGMIFCYITGTPCIVIKNNNFKIESSYETWLQNNQNFIRLVNGNILENELMYLSKELLSLEYVKRSNMLDNFRPLIECLTT